MSSLIDITGQRFGCLTVTRQGPAAANNARAVRWWCACDCGERRLVHSRSLRTGHTRSCGCSQRGPRPHSVSRLPEHPIWRGIIARCENPHVKSYGAYGGRGVRICARWRQSFAAFLEDMGPRPTPQHSVERDDVNGDYEPENCRWGTPIEQANNKRCTRYVIYGGRKLPLAVAVREAGSVIHIEAAWIRIKTGWPTEVALETPRLHESHAATGREAIDERAVAYAGNPRRAA